MIKINCDIGEREPDNVVDIELMKYIQIANIACGGHAGNEETIAVFRDLAYENDVEIAAHLSYPDKENFGRVTMDISPKDLMLSLDEQYALMPDVKMVKFHGGLYNDCSSDSALAEVLTGWLVDNAISRIITPHNSELANAALVAGVAVMAEAFAERRYVYDAETDRLSLVNRKKEYASIHECDEAVQHTVDIINGGFVHAYVEKPGERLVQEKVTIKADTICIHSDSDISLELAKRLNEMRN